MTTHYRETRGWLTPMQTGRPPDEAAPPAECEGLTSTVFGDRQCGGYALWLVPEAPLCHLHMTPEVRDLAVRRRARWAEEAADLWRRILRETGSLPARDTKDRDDAATLDEAWGTP